MILVIDASVTAAWIFADERDAYSLQVADHIANHKGLVPALWRWEIQNTLLSAMRRKRIREASLAQHLSDLQELNIEYDFTPSFGAEVSLAKEHRLSVYDAAYLELAMRRNGKLATKDDSLRRAAESAGVYFAAPRTGAVTRWTSSP